MGFLELAKERYSCRMLTNAPVEDEKLEMILEAGIAAPTACDLQPYRIWVLRGADAAKKIGTTTRFTFGAETFLVVGADESSAWVRSSDGANFATVDASIVATHMMLEIQDLGLGTTWVGSFDEPKFKELFPETAPYHLVAIFPVGYPAENAAPAPGHTSRRPLSEAVQYL